MLNRAMVLVSLTALALVCGSCKDKLVSMSSFEALIQRQHKVWEDMIQSFRQGKGDLNAITTAQVMLYDVPGRIESDYKGPNKAAVLEKINLLRAQLNEQFDPKVTSTPRGTVLKPGVTMESVTQSVESVYKLYQDFYAALKK